MRRLQLLSVVAAVGTCLNIPVCAQRRADPTALVSEAREAISTKANEGRHRALRLLHQALLEWKTSGVPLGTEYADASVLYGLLLLGEQQPAGPIIAQTDEAIRIYRANHQLVPPSALALALEVKSSAHGRAGETDKIQPLVQESTRIRAQILEQMQQSAADADEGIGTIHRIGGAVSVPVKLEAEEPGYTEPARLAKTQGAVVLSVIVGADGRIHRVRLVRSLGFELDEAALNAVRKWRFTPAMRHGEAVSVSANIEVSFRLL